MDIIGNLILTSFGLAWLLSFFIKIFFRIEIECIDKVLMFWCMVISMNWFIFYLMTIIFKMYIFFWVLIKNFL